MMDRDARLGDFTKTAALLIRANGSLSGAADIAQQTRAGERVMAALKAATPALTLSGSAAADFGVLSQAFVQSLTTTGAFDAVRTGGALALPLDNLIFRVASSAMTGSTQGEGAWRPITRLETNSGLMTRSWATAIIVLSDEFLRFAPNALRLLEAELRKAAIAAVDRAFLTAMTTGAPSIPGSPLLLDDINAAADLMGLDASARLVLIAPATDVRRAALSTTAEGLRRYPELTVRGGEIGGVRVVPSDNIPTSGSPAIGSALLIDASQVAVGSGELEMDASRNAALQMSATRLPQVHSRSCPCSRRTRRAAHSARGRLRQAALDRCRRHPNQHRVVAP